MYIYACMCTCTCCSSTSAAALAYKFAAAHNHTAQPSWPWCRFTCAHAALTAGHAYAYIYGHMHMHMHACIINILHMHGPYIESGPWCLAILFLLARVRAPAPLYMLPIGPEGLIWVCFFCASSDPRAASRVDLAHDLHGHLMHMVKCSYPPHAYAPRAGSQIRSDHDQITR